MGWRDRLVVLGWVRVWLDILAPPIRAKLHAPLHCMSSEDLVDKVHVWKKFFVYSYQYQIYFYNTVPEVGLNVRLSKCTQ